MLITIFVMLMGILLWSMVASMWISIPLTLIITLGIVVLVLGYLLW